MSMEDNPTLQAVYPTYKKLLMATNIEENDHECIKSMKTVARESLEKRFSLTCNTALKASFLHPNTKNLNFFDLQQKQAVHDAIRSELDTLLNCDVTVQETAEPPASSEEPPPKRAKLETDCMD